MSTLHIHQRSTDIERILATASDPSDAILLMGQGLQSALLDTHIDALRHSTCPVYVLRDDLPGAHPALPETVTLIDYAGFVELSAALDRSVSWP